MITIPVGENSIYTGADRVALDTPAYLSKSGYTMLPLRAAVKAFDREPTKVDWNAGEKEVTILKGDVYFQMKAGEKKMLYGAIHWKPQGNWRLSMAEPSFRCGIGRRFSAQKKFSGTMKRKPQRSRAVIRKTGANKQENIGKGRLLGTIDALFSTKD